MRPYGEITHALSAVWQQGPATVTQAAHRACVGLSAARYTATRMVDRGQLVVVEGSRPAVLAVPSPQACNVSNAADAAAVMLHQGFWGYLGGRDMT